MGPQREVLGPGDATDSGAGLSSEDQLRPARGDVLREYRFDAVEVIWRDAGKDSVPNTKDQLPLFGWSSTTEIPPMDQVHPAPGPPPTPRDGDTFIETLRILELGILFVPHG